MPRKSLSGFTLVELLIVVIILSILAGVVVPQFTSSAEEAKEAAVLTNLQNLRQAIECYKVQHKGNYPGDAANWATFVTHLTTQTDADGNAGTKYGPYLRVGIPRNPTNNLNDGKLSVAPATWVADDATGWVYNPNTGAIAINATGAAPSGVNWFDM